MILKEIKNNPQWNVDRVPMIEVHPTVCNFCPFGVQKKSESESESEERLEEISKMLFGLIRYVPALPLPLR